MENTQQKKRFIVIYDEKREKKERSINIFKGLKVTTK